MANPATFQDDVLGSVNTHGVKTGDYNIEDKKEVERAIRDYAHEEPFFPQFVDYRSVQQGARTYQWREVVDQRTLDPKLTTPLVEGFGTNSIKYEIQEFESSVENFGAKAEYTKEKVQYDYDDTLALITGELKEYVHRFYEDKIGNELVKSNYIITYDNTQDFPLTTLMDKARIIFKKKKCREDGKYFSVIIPPEVEAQLLMELRKGGDSLLPTLPDGVKENIGLEGFIGAYDNFKVYTSSDDCMYKYVDNSGNVVDATDTNGHTECAIIFLAKSHDGKKSVRCSKGTEPTIIHNPLGSGLIQKADGSGVEEDTNHRKGSFAVNIDSFGLCTEHPECRLVSWVNVNKIEAEVATKDLATTGTKTGKQTSPITN